jgi:uncharacterized circularly permuted ATP-grasp superfamily protein/uncharacterized alpha-E superfamily protein
VAAASSFESWDEMVSGSGHLRPHWQQFFSVHGPFAPDVLENRRQSARGMLFRNGVTYTVYGGNDLAASAERPWPLDPIPLVISAEEWREVSAGVAQRAALAAAVLEDLYGPRRLVADAVLPAAVVHANPGFLRPCHGVSQQPRLLLFAADLIRGADGAWRVLANRAQSPAGMGYALENRTVLGQTMADAVRNLPVAGLAPYFATIRSSIDRLATQASGADGRPYAVLLSPGPLNEAAFEHAYLARHLGLTLVEGGDLLVRGQAVHLKSLSGLQRIDVILRRVDDDFCDPLELRTDSELGVPGLLEVVRSGRVSVVNSLGAGIIDSLALAAFMPAMCDRLLGASLLLPNVPTLWAGNPAHRRELLASLRNFVVRPAFSAADSRGIVAADLAAEELQRLAATIEADPVIHAAQPLGQPSTAPSWMDGRVEPRPVVLRTFACFGPDGWSVMPGGLGRISADERYPVVSFQEAAGSKDVWIVSEPPRRAYRSSVPSKPPLLVPPPRQPRHEASDLHSRAAEHLFWVGRYAERADMLVRMLRATADRIADEERPGVHEELQPLLRILGWTGAVPVAVVWAGHADRVSAARQALETAFDPFNPGGLSAAVAHLHSAASGLRNSLAPDLDRILRQLQGIVAAPPAWGNTGSHSLRLDDAASALAGMIGLEQDGMPRGPGWHFLVLGRRLERAVGIAAMIRGSGLLEWNSYDPATLDVLLELAAAGSRVRMGIAAVDPTAERGSQALTRLLADADHPRSLLFVLESIHSLLSSLPHVAGQERSGPIDNAFEVVTGLVNEFRTGPLPGDPASLQGVVARLERLLPSISEHVTEAYFAHVHAQRA